MANRTKSKKHLKAIPGGRSAVGDLLSGRVSKGPKKTPRKKRESPPQELPRELQPLADVFAAGRTIEKETRFKIEYAKRKVEEFCLEDWTRRFAATHRRPASIDYLADHSKFKFVMTSRTTLTNEKVEELRDLGLPIDEMTTLVGLQINYDAIQQHKLEDKLRAALESLDVSEGVLDEIFTPKVELKDTFYDRLAELVGTSLGKGEKLEDKLLNVLQILNPTSQARNVEVLELTTKQCFDLIEKTEIEAEEEIA